jgi:hypothetical protein
MLQEGQVKKEMEASISGVCGGVGTSVLDVVAYSTLGIRTMSKTLACFVRLFVDEIVVSWIRFESSNTLPRKDIIRTIFPDLVIPKACLAARIETSNVR